MVAEHVLLPQQWRGSEERSQSAKRFSSIQKIPTVRRAYYSCSAQVNAAGGKPMLTVECLGMDEGQESAQSAAANGVQVSFEARLDELEKVVKALEAGDMPLDRSLELFSRGMTLSDTCRKQLEEAETRVEQLIRREGLYQPEPFRPEK
jgi:exodeoxyribonuclease VII small subunit